MRWKHLGTVPPQAFWCFLLWERACPPDTSDLWPLFFPLPGLFPRGGLLRQHAAKADSKPLTRNVEFQGPGRMLGGKKYPQSQHGKCWEAEWEELAAAEGSLWAGWHHIQAFILKHNHGRVLKKPK